MEKKFNDRYIHVLKNFNFFLFFLISLNFYYKSLKGCQGTQEECVIKYRDYLGKYLIINLFYSVLIISFEIFLFLNNFFPKSKLIFIISIYIIIMYHYRGEDLNNHGTYNIIAYIILSFFFIFIFQFIYFITGLFNKTKKYRFFKVIILILISIVFYKFFLPKFLCRNWDKGLGKISIKNNITVDSCFWKKPKVCNINLFNGIIDLSKIFYPNGCIHAKNERNYFIKYTNKLYYKYFDFIYPNELNYKYPDDVFLEVLIKKVRNEILPISNNSNLDIINNNKKNAYATLHFDKKTSLGEININIIKNETLIKEREKLLYKNTKFDNILVIYIDALSRQHFLRKMKLTRKILEKYYWRNEKKKKNLKNPEKNTIKNSNNNNIINRNKNNQNSKDNILKSTNPYFKISSYQFLKYHAFYASTPPSIMPMFYGENFNNKLKKRGTSIIQHLKNSGFITADSGNHCSKTYLDIQKIFYENYTYFKFEDCDYQIFNLYCDPNYMDPKMYYSNLKGPYSIIRKCLYGKDTFEYEFEFGKKFLEKYKNYKRKFLRLAFSDAHESSGESIKYLDKPLSDFINFYIENYFNEKSIIFIISDHGNGMPSINNLLNSFYLGQDFEFEKHSPSLFFIIPNLDFYNFHFQKINFINQTSIEINEQRFFNSFNIYETFLDILNMKNYNQNIESLFHEINGNLSNCEKFGILSESQFCICKKENE